MVINTREMMEVVGVLADEENVRLTVQSSAKGAMITGVGAFIGGVLGGPIGLPIGGAVGGLIGMKANKSFKPLSEIVRRDLTERQQQELKDKLQNIVSQINMMDAVQLLMMLRTDRVLMNLFIKESLSFVVQATNAQLTT